MFSVGRIPRKPSDPIPKKSFFGHMRFLCHKTEWPKTKASSTAFLVRYPEDSIATFWSNHFGSRHPNVHFEKWKSWKKLHDYFWIVATAKVVLIILVWIKIWKRRFPCYVKETSIIHTRWAARRLKKSAGLPLNDNIPTNWAARSTIIPVGFTLLLRSRAVGVLPLATVHPPSLKESVRHVSVVAACHRSVVRGVGS